MSIDALLNSPKYYSAIIRSTGLLSGKEREERILHLIENNIWLAAKCKNTCVLEEESITDAILLKCASLIDNEQNTLAIVALLELGEMGVLCYLLQVNDALAFNLYADPDQSVAHLFSRLGENLSDDLFWPIYRKIEELGYPLGLDLYNLALARTPKNEDASLILDEMRTSGIKADALTYFHLISKTNTYQDALVFYNVFEEEDCQDVKLVNGVIQIMIQLAPSRQTAEKFFLASRQDTSSYSAKKVRSAFYARMIEFSDNFQDCIEYLRLTKDFISSGSKKNALFNPVLSSYCLILERRPTFDYYFFKSFSLFCELTNIACPEGFFIKKPPTNQKRVLIDKAISHMIRKIPSPQMVFELFRTMETYHMDIDEEVVEAAVEIADSTDYLRRILKSFKLKDPDSRWVFHCIERFNYDLTECLYNHLSEIGYQFNVYIFNVLIKMAPAGKALYYMDEMEDHEVIPDIVTIQSLIHKIRDKDSLFQILSLASIYQIKPDMHLFGSLKRRTRYDKVFKGIILSLNNQDFESNILLPSWERLLQDVYNEVI